MTPLPIESQHHLHIYHAVMLNKCSPIRCLQTSELKLCSRKQPTTVISWHPAHSCHTPEPGFYQSNASTTRGKPVKDIHKALLYRDSQEKGPITTQKLLHGADTRLRIGTRGFQPCSLYTTVGSSHNTSFLWKWSSEVPSRCALEPLHNSTNQNA